MRLIDADSLIEPFLPFKGMSMSVKMFLAAVNNAKTIDTTPVRHGHWETDGMIMDDGEYLMTRCTACGEAYEYGYNMPFCPNCGADMRENDENH